MARSKNRERLSKAEKTAQKNGLIGVNNTATGKYTANWGEFSEEVDYGPRRTGLDTRRPAKSGSTGSIVHAILFCVLVVIIVSWALGY